MFDEIVENAYFPLSVNCYDVKTVHLMLWLTVVQEDEIVRTIFSKYNSMSRK